MLRFKLRSLLIGVSVVAVTLAVAESQTRDWRERYAIAREIETYGGSDVWFDDDNNVTWITVRDRILSPKIAKFDHLQNLYCSGSNVTDDDLRHLRSLPRIMCIHLDGTRITDSGLTHLTGVGQITALRLSGTNVTLQGVERLKSKRPDIYVLHRELGLWLDEEPAEPSDQPEPSS